MLERHPRKQRRVYLARVVACDPEDHKIQRISLFRLKGMKEVLGIQQLFGARRVRREGHLIGQSSDAVNPEFRHK